MTDNRQPSFSARDPRPAPATEALRHDPPHYVLRLALLVTGVVAVVASLLTLIGFYLGRLLGDGPALTAAVHGSYAAGAVVLVITLGALAGKLASLWRHRGEPVVLRHAGDHLLIEDPQRWGPHPRRLEFQHIVGIDVFPRRRLLGDGTEVELRVWTIDAEVTSVSFVTTEPDAPGRLRRWLGLRDPATAPTPTPAA